MFMRSCAAVALVWVVAAGLANGQDGHRARLGKPVALTPYAPAAAYLPPGAFDSAVVPAGGTGARSAPVVPVGWGDSGPPGGHPPAVLPGQMGAPVGGFDRLSQVCCGGCGPDGSGWLRADLLLWSVQGTGTPPLVVRDAPGTPRGLVGLPGTPGRQVPFGGNRLADQLRPGLRLSGGYWLDDDRLLGIGADFMFLASGNDGARFVSDGDPPLSRPFFNVATGSADAELVAYPGVVRGAVGVAARNTFVGAGVFLQHNLCCALDHCGQGYRVDLLAGYRFYGLNDDLRICEDLVAIGAERVPVGTVITVTDHFRTENTFHGGLLGLSVGAQRGNWVLNLRGGAAFGTMNRELTINGSTVVQVLGRAPSVRAGGLFAQPSNIGQYTRDTFAVVPEAGLTLGYQFSSCLGAHVGYSFAYLPNVWRAGDQIDRGVDPAQLRGAASALGRPAVPFASTGAFVQGINFGLTLRY